MSNNADVLVLEIHTEFEALLTYVCLLYTSDGCRRRG